MHIRARYIGHGKKIRRGQKIIHLYGQRFIYRHPWVKLTDEFIERSHLDDPAIRSQVIATLRNNYGIALMIQESKSSGKIVIEEEEKTIEKPEETEESEEVEEDTQTIAGE